MNILVIAEHDNQQLKSSTLNTLSAALCLKQAVTDGEAAAVLIDVLVIGFACEAVAESLRAVNGISRVLWVDSPAYQHHLAENIADITATIAANDYAYILAPATTFGKNFLPRTAALLNVEQISDVCSIQHDDQHNISFLRPIYAGNALETVTSQHHQHVLSIRTSAFSAATLSDNIAPIEKRESRPDLGLSHYEGAETTRSERPELTQAKVIVSGGRGFQSAEKFKLIETLADKLNAAIGASRAAVDAGFAPNDYQVGQTGKIVAPDLYIAIGISGAIQHLAGMKDSRVIVAINKDPEAPIFKIATYGLVGDLFEILPELTAAL